MGFINLVEWLEKDQKLKIPHTGTVINNVDPLEQGRVQVLIAGIFTETDTEKAQWIYQINNTGFGGCSGVSSLMVPDIGSEIQVEFPYDDIYFGFYRGYVHTGETQISELNTDYPDTWGFRDSTGTILYVNRKTLDFKLEHASGVKLEMNAEGTFTATVPKDMMEVVSGDKTSAINGAVTLNIGKALTMTAIEKATMKGNEVEVDGGGGNITGVVCQQNICPLIGSGHIDASVKVKASQ